MSTTGLIHIVDDEVSVREGLDQLLRSLGFDTQLHANAEAFLIQELPDRVSCILLDLHMPGINGLELQNLLANRDSPPPVVYLSGRADISSSVEAMKLGALDFLQKPVDESALLKAITHALHTDQSNRRQSADICELQDRIATLSDRENQVFRLIARGKLNKQIAAELDISERTVKAHRANVMEKMAAQSLAHLILMANSLGLIST